MNRRIQLRTRLRALALAAAALTATGCTSAISTAYLRDALWDVGDHAAEAEPRGVQVGDAAAADGDAAETAAGELAAVDAARRQAAIDEAMARIARIGPLDEAARSTLVETLQHTQQEDWPVVVEAFATSLAASRPSLPETRSAGDEAEAPPESAGGSHTVAKADLDHAAPAAVPSAPLPPLAEAAPAEAAPAEAAPAEGVPAASAPAEPARPTPPPSAGAPAESPAAPEPEPSSVAAAAPPALAVRNACFARRVQAWGVLDRFPDARFRPGQEVIVYFELDNLTSGESAAGHTTCIDTALALVDADGRVLHEWSFEPIAETCGARRRDYFARYVVRIPDAVPAGGCRIDVAVVDTLAGTTARASLPAEIVAAAR